MYAFRYLVLLLFLSGCAGTVVRTNTNSFYAGQMLTNEQILLKNIVGSAYGRTPTYVATSGVSSNVELGGGLTAVFPNGPPTESLTAAINGEKSQTATLTDYGATKAAKRLYDEVTPTLFLRLLIDGWQSRLIETILIGGIRAPIVLRQEIRRQADINCRNPDRPYTHALCEWNKELIQECGDPTRLPLTNDPLTHCKFEHMQIAFNWIDLSGSGFQLRSKLAKNDQSKEVPTPFIKFVGGTTRLKKLRDAIVKDDDQALLLVVRTPNQIVRFLGALARLQLVKGQHPLEIPLEFKKHLKMTPIFRVVSGIEEFPGAVISVHYPGRGFFHVPEPDLTTDGHDQSLEVIGFVQELLNQSRQEAPIESGTIAVLQ